MFEMLITFLFLVPG